jgi:hypothetical protein
MYPKGFSVYITLGLTGMILEAQSLMDTKDWIVVISTLLGPILAVQAQKAVESFRECRSRKVWVFTQLMATRAARVSPEHVQALNMIDIVFCGVQMLGILRRAKSEQAVLDKWKEYHDHLGVKVDDEGLRIWNLNSDELFTNLLFEMAKDVGYSFDRVQLKRGSYSPIAHGDLEQEQTALRRAAMRTFTGETPLKMEVVGFPVNADSAAEHQATLQKLNAALDGGRLQLQVAGEPKSEA